MANQIRRLASQTPMARTKTTTVKQAQAACFGSEKVRSMKVPVIGCCDRPPSIVLLYGLLVPKAPRKLASHKVAGNVRPQFSESRRDVGV